MFVLIFYALISVAFSLGLLLFVGAVFFGKIAPILVVQSLVGLSSCFVVFLLLFCLENYRRIGAIEAGGYERKNKKT